MNKYRNSQIYTKTFFPIIREKTLNFLQGKNLGCAMMAPREEGCARSGHVTGQRSLRGRGSRGNRALRRNYRTLLYTRQYVVKHN